jgi:hypothetical protein
VDLSQNSNSYVTCHAEHGHSCGWLAMNTAPTLFGCYTEGGTVCRIGSTGASISPTVGAHLGDPAVWAGGQWRRLQIGGPTPGDPKIDLFPNTRTGPAILANYWGTSSMWRATGNPPPPITHRRASVSELATKWQIWACAGSREHAYAISDGDADDVTDTVFALTATDTDLHNHNGVPIPLSPPSVLSVTLKNVWPDSQTNNDETFIIKGTTAKGSTTEKITIPKQAVGPGKSVTKSGTEMFISIQSVQLSDPQNANWQFSVGTTIGFKPATMWLPRGIMIGDTDIGDTTGLPCLNPNDPSVFRLEARNGLGDAVPIDDPYVGKQDGWHKSDLVHDASLNAYPFWMCIKAGHGSKAMDSAGNPYPQDQQALFTPVGGIGGYLKLDLAKFDFPVVGQDAKLGQRKQGAPVEPVPIIPNVGVNENQNQLAYYTESIEVIDSHDAKRPARSVARLTFGTAKCRRWIYNNTSRWLYVTTGLVNPTTKKMNNTIIRGNNAAWVMCDGTNMLRQTADSNTADPDPVP